MNFKSFIKMNTISFHNQTIAFGRCFFKFKLKSIAFKKYVNLKFVLKPNFGFKT